ncbi:MAG TPA: hypothetical protein VGG10_09545 [Rhizomicrobium sp.]|jgi:hypothetical protein
MAGDLFDRFTTRRGDQGRWEVIDRTNKRVLAQCDSLKAAQAIVWFFRGDIECGTRLMLEALEESEPA